MSNVNWEYYNSYRAAKAFNMSQLLQLMQLLEQRHRLAVECDEEMTHLDGWIHRMNENIKSLLGMTDKPNNI